MEIKDFSYYADIWTDPYHFCQSCREIFLSYGFEEINENNLPDTPPKKGFICRNFKTFLAYNYGGDEAFVVGAAHCDSPNIQILDLGSLQNSTTKHKIIHHEKYANVKPLSIFSRGLKMTGAVFYKTSNSDIHMKLIDSGDKPIAFIPPPDVNENMTKDFVLSISKNNLRPIFGSSKVEDLGEYIAKLSGLAKSDITHTDLFLVDCKKASVFNGILTSARIDNLLNTYCCLKAFLKTSPNKTMNIFISYDNEETGSLSHDGARGDILEKVFRLFIKDNKKIEVMKRSSIIISADAAHATHPGHIEALENSNPSHAGSGVILKGIGQCSTSLNMKAVNTILNIAKQKSAKVTLSGKRNGRSTGGTIGPKMEVLDGIECVDIGVANWAMHSARESVYLPDMESEILIMEEIYSNYTGFSKQYKEF